MHTFVLLAHLGHSGDHGWLAGALQPLLSQDHLLAGLFVAALLSVGLGRLILLALDRRQRQEDGT